MRRHGWAGDVPRDEEEAVARITAAARQAIDRHGGVSLSDVARQLGVTRQTIYRYFPTTDALLASTAISAAGEFLDRLAAHLDPYTDPADAVVEGVAHTLEQLPHDRYLGLVLEPGRSSAFTAGVTSDVARAFGRSILHRFNVDWPGAGVDEQALDELVEFMLRILQSMILDPGHPPRRGTELRGFLRRWVAPAVAAHQRHPRDVAGQH